MKKRNLKIFFYSRIRLYTYFILLPSILPASEGLDYLNQLRATAQMTPFTSNTYLEQAARNHSDYMQLNRTAGHTEKPEYDGFTGETSSERAVYAGYASRVVSENVSGGNQNIFDSIDNLFAAIYHRFGFLSPQYDQIGIGISDDGSYYTYDMGNRALEALCEGEHYSGGTYYYNVCSDSEKKIDTDLYLKKINTTMQSAPEVILWPPVDGKKIPPVFYEEIPDPLPTQSVSGYPVSVIFNSAYFSTLPEDVTLKLFDKNGTSVQTLFMRADNDPNRHFSPYEYALFPTQRLKWGGAYTAQLTYTVEDREIQKEWCFETQSIGEFASKYYQIENTADTSYSVMNETPYAFYFVPQNENDQFGGLSYSYTVSNIDFSYIDRNTCLITLTGEAGQYATFSFDNGIKLTLTLAQNDTAQIPVTQICQTTPEENASTTLYDITSFYVAYNKNDAAQYVLVMPSVNKVYTHVAGHITPEDLTRIDMQFKSFPSYNNGEICFPALLDDSSGEGGAAQMADQCYNVNFFYIQKELTDAGMSFMLYYTPQEKLYEGIAGQSESFKVVRDASGIYNDASISGEDYSSFSFDTTGAKAVIDD